MRAYERTNSVRVHRRVRVIRNILSPDLNQGCQHLDCILIIHQVGPFDALPPAIGFVPVMTAEGGGKTPFESFMAL
jgi:hypothetical protein